MTTVSRFQFNAILQAALIPVTATIFPSATNTVAVQIDRTLGSNLTVMQFADDTQPVLPPINLADGAGLQLALVGGGGSGSWSTWSAATPTTPGYVFVLGRAPTAGANSGVIKNYLIQRVGAKYFVYPGTSPTEDLSRYDVIFGDGVDPTTHRFILNLNPAGGTTYANGPRVIYYTPAGTDTGPTNAIINGVYCTTYTRRLISGCKALVRTCTVAFSGAVTAGVTVGDWVLFPSGTLNMVTDTNGETTYGDMNSQSGPSLRYPHVFGTYDSSDMTNPAKWNQLPCKFKFSAFKHQATGAFFQHQGRNEQNVAFVCLQFEQTNVSGATAAYGLTGLHRGILFERCTMDGMNISLGGTYNNIQYYGYSIASITSVGTTATVTLNASANATSLIQAIKIANDAGQTLLANIHLCTGATAAAYNTPANSPGVPLTWLSTTTFSYPMNADAGGVPATTTTAAVSFSSDGAPDAISSTDCVVNQCGVGYVGACNGAHAIGIFAGAVKRLRIYDLVNHHNGWPRAGSRTAVPWSIPATPNLATSITQSGGVMTILTPSTAGLSVDGFIYLANATTFNGSQHITAINPNVSVTCSCDPNTTSTYGGGAAVSGYISGNTLNLTNVTAPGIVKIGQVIYGPGVGITQANITGGSGSTWTIDGSAQTVGSAGSPVSFSCCAAWGNPESTGFSMTAGDPPDQFSHGLYISNQCSDIRIYDILNSWDCVNQKLTGGPYVIRGLTDYRCPMSFIFGPQGNDDAEGGYSWPQSATLIAEDLLQVFSDNMNVANDRGNAAWLPNSKVGTKISNSIVITNSNDTAHRTRSGWVTNGVQFPDVGAVLGYRVEHSIMSDWGVSNVTQEATTKEFAYNITEDAVVLPAQIPTTGANVANVSNQLVTDTPAAFQAKLAAMKSKNLANTFRLTEPEFAGFTPIGDGSGTDLATELAMFDKMMYDPGKLWNRKVQAHFCGPIGR